MNEWVELSSVIDLAMKVCELRTYSFQPLLETAKGTFPPKIDFQA